MSSITNSKDMNLGKLWKIARDRESGHAIVHGVTKRQTRLNMHAGTFSHMVLFVGNNLSTLG